MWDICFWQYCKINIKQTYYTVKATSYGVFAFLKKKVWVCLGRLPSTKWVIKHIYLKGDPTCAKKSYTTQMSIHLVLNSSSALMLRKQLPCTIWYEHSLSDVTLISVLCSYMESIKWINAKTKQTSCRTTNVKAVLILLWVDLGQLTTEQQNWLWCWYIYELRCLET